MLSILIPTYNYNVTKLAGDLQQQAKSSGIDFEIIIAEDGSQKFLKENAEVEKMDFVRHLAFENNVGRGANINRLADAAQFDILLIIDSDAEVCSEDFLKNYLPFCNENAVVVGGTAYDENENNPKYSLRLKYGRAREALTVQVRENGKFQIFTTFNILISKKIFNQIRFNDNIREYGQEDTLFRSDLLRQNYKITHIENPLIHRGLDENAIFLKKTETSMKNLFLLYQTKKYPELRNYSNLLNTFLKLKKCHLIWIVNLFFMLSKKMITGNLMSKNPSLFLFDLYKLGFLCNIATQN
ncbi:MAG: glycosyltransferase [Prevotellaceae bacterium]|jgi:glycosyltransferase involved in cell wall biosynthesis|nr:glycosyltransferase [Prevotellaceae bacterium]